MNSKLYSAATCLLLAGFVLCSCGPGEFLGPTLTTIPAYLGEWYVEFSGTHLMNSESMGKFISI